MGILIYTFSHPVDFQLLPLLPKMMYLVSLSRWKLFGQSSLIFPHFSLQTLGLFKKYSLYLSISSSLISLLYPVNILISLNMWDRIIKGTSGPRKEIQVKYLLLPLFASQNSHLSSVSKFNANLFYFILTGDVNINGFCINSVIYQRLFSYGNGRLLPNLRAVDALWRPAGHIP